MRPFSPRLFFASSRSPSLLRAFSSPAMFDSPQIRAAASVALILSSLGSLTSFITFMKFSWLKTYPRSLYFWFVCVDLLAAFSSMLVLATHDIEGSCFSHWMSIVVYHFLWVAEYLWIACICHAVHYQLTGMDMQLSAAQDAESLMGHRAKRATYQRVYHAICWVVPAILTVVVLIASEGGCNMDSHAIDYMPSYQVPDLLTFFFCIVMAIVNVVKARKCMRLLDVHTGGGGGGGMGGGGSGSGGDGDGDGDGGEDGSSPAQGSIHEDSIKFHQVFVGMFVTFGLTRFPSVTRSVIHLLGNPNSIPGESDAEHALDIMAGFTVPIQGFFLFCWFAYKFNYRRIWCSWWRPAAAAASGADDRVVETISGMY